MIRVFLFLLVILLLAAGLHWLADRPGTITVEWLGYIIETSVFRGLLILAAAVALVMIAWSGLREMWRSPAAVGRYLERRRQKRGLHALTGGIIAVGAGDRALAVRYASQARKTLPIPSRSDCAGSIWKRSVRVPGKRPGSTPSAR
jgi:HemY protein